MRNNILLSEKDLFNYIFFKKESDEEKLRILEDSGFDFNHVLYNHLKEVLKENLPLAVKDKIKLSVKCYLPAEKILLYLINSIKPAAGFGKPSAKDKSKDIYSQATYSDSQKTYLVRIINFEKSANIYLFSMYEEKINNIIVTLNPGGESYKMLNNSIPLEISHPVNADSIEINFY